MLGFMRGHGIGGQPEGFWAGKPPVVVDRISRSAPPLETFVWPPECACEGCSRNVCLRHVGGVVFSGGSSESALGKSRRLGVQ